MAPFYIWIGPRSRFHQIKDLGNPCETPASTLPALRLPVIVPGVLISQLLLPADMLLFSGSCLLICEVRLLLLQSFITVKSTVSHVHSLFPKMSFQMFIQVVSLRTYRDKPLLCICKTELPYFQQFGKTTLHIGLAKFFPKSLYNISIT